MTKKRGGKLTALAGVAMLLAFLAFQDAGIRARAASDSYHDRLSYFYYMQEYRDAARPEREMVLDVTSFSQRGENGAVVYHNMEGSGQGIQVRRENCSLTFPVQVESEGLYCMRLTYLPYDDKNSQIKFGVLIDGNLPYTEANNCILSRVYQNNPITQNEDMDDVRPRAVQQREWRTQYVYDQTGISGNLAFYLEAGQREITLCFEDAQLLIEDIRLCQEPYILSYQDYISLYMQKGYEETEGILETVQAETYYRQSGSFLWPDSDKSSPLMQPFSYENTRINFGGGNQWKAPGQWISWEIEVPEDGFYNIGMKYRQGYLDGLFSSRKISIDGEVPFRELDSVRFDYTSQWKNRILENEYEPYHIYLTAGKHILTMENVMGEMEDTMEVLQNCIANLNEIYLSVIMITGSEPDQFRDYYLPQRLPHLKEDLQENAGLLLEEAERLIEVVGARGKETAFFEDIAYDLISYSENITDLTYKNRIEDLKNNISSLSAKMTQYQEQALDIDYIVILSSDMDMPRDRMNPLEWVVYQAKSFVASFREKEVEKEEKGSVRVWVGGGSDQYEILENMITDLFTPATGIEVELELSTASLVQAIVADTGPDVVVGVGADQVVNLALRGGLEELSGYEGYAELIGEYVEGSDIPFILEGRAYGIPNTGAYNMMFVRTDIFESLGLEIPSTWDEVYDVTQVLQRNNMSLAAVPGFPTLLYQMGGQYYNDSQTRVMFDEDVAIEAFTRHTDFYTKYDFPLSYDFVSRFRTGEMPIAVAPYTTYNTLKYSAPEINGLWRMYPIPGTVREDGSVDATQTISGGTGTLMLKNSRKKDAAWAFIKWWSSADAQERYAKDLEAVMGISARYAALNKEAFRKIDWTDEERDVLLQEMEKLNFLPIVPGDYYVGRGIDNTFRSVVYDDKNVREMLTKWTIQINDELARKRKEFFRNN